MPRIAISLKLVVALMLVGAALAGLNAQTPPATVADTEAVVARATQAIQELQATLIGRLKAAMTEGGPAAAVTVCRDEAQALTATVGAKYQVAIGRTSHRLRNPNNAPRAWAVPTVSAGAGVKLADARPATLALGNGRVGLLRPIGTLDFCVTCHGPRETVNAAIGTVLATAYPKDQAVDFAVGDLRGWIWVEVGE
ncbi:MAG: DUF3365 domain-containing protein [Acidobacteria bacterium]|nr:DUF3365 domain-containing protein [Acidobacteriota bacterium]